MGFILVTANPADDRTRIMLNTDNINAVVELPDDRCLIVLRSTVIGRNSIEPAESFGLIRGRLAIETSE